MLLLGVMFLVMAFFVMQLDFGQVVLILFGWGVIYFVAGALMVLLIGFAGVAVAGGVLVYNVSEYFACWIDGFLASEVDLRMQFYYVYIAIQEGGFWGVGVGEGQVKWVLPDAYTDFIIVVVAEEYGLVLVLFIIALFGIVAIWSLLRLTRECDIFICFAGMGLVCMFSA